MKTTFMITLFLTGTAIAALPPHFEQARVISYVAAEGAKLFPFDPIVNLSNSSGLIFNLKSASNCEAQVEVEYGQLPENTVGPLPFKNLMVITKSCPN